MEAVIKGDKCIMEIETVKNAMSRELDWDNAENVRLISVNSHGNLYSNPFTAAKGGLLLFTQELADYSASAVSATSLNFNITKNDEIEANEVYNMNIFSFGSSSYLTISSGSVSKRFITIKAGDVIASTCSTSGAGPMLSIIPTINEWTFVPYKE